MKRLSTTLFTGCCLAILALPLSPALAQEGGAPSQAAAPIRDASAAPEPKPDRAAAPAADPDDLDVLEGGTEAGEQDGAQGAGVAITEAAEADVGPVGESEESAEDEESGEGEAGDGLSAARARAPAGELAEPEPPDHAPSTVHNGATSPGNHRVTSSLSGSIGLWRTDSAILGQNGLTRISLAGLFVAQDNFPIHGTRTTHAGARLAVDLVFLKYFEGFLSYGIASDFADEGERSRLVQTLGDFQFGLKGSSEIFRGFYLGGALHFGLAPGFGADWTSGVSFDFAPRLIASWDVRALDAAIPLLLHLNLGAIFTNQDRVYGDFSPSAFDEFAFDLNRHNRLGIGLGIEIPLPWVTPFLEWNMALPITSSELTTHTGKSVEAASAMEHRMSLGLKVTALPDITFQIALDFGLSGEVARGIAATPNVAFAAGLSYAFDPFLRHRDGAPSACLPPPAGAAPAREDDDEEDEDVEAVPAAAIAAHAAAAGADGEAQEAGALTGPGAADEIAPAPRPRLFLMVGTSARAGRITFVDGARAPIDVPADGFELMLDPGTYEVLIQAEGALAKVELLNVDGSQVRLDLALTPRPAEELFAPGEVKAVIPATPIFGEAGADLLPESTGLLDQIADALLSGKVARLRIEGHMDNRGDAAQKLALTAARAQAVRAALIARGVEAARLVAEGKGVQRPIASNALTRGRVRNCRIELHVLPAGQQQEE